MKEFDLENTKERLIKVAIEMFAEIGYDKTSIRELAKRADVNIAAINYHFGGKEGLYNEVFEYITEYMNSWAVPLIDKYNKFLEDANGNFKLVDTIEWIDKLLNSFFNNFFELYEENLILYKIIIRERLNPAYSFDNIYQLASIKFVENIIGDLLAKISKLSINDEKVVIYTSSIIGQIETFTSLNTKLKTQLNVQELNQTQKDIIKEVILNHIETIFAIFLKR